jgi:hypothetical protein
LVGLPTVRSFDGCGSADFCEICAADLRATACQYPYNHNKETSFDMEAMSFDEAIMRKVLAEFSPDFALLALDFFKHYEKVNGEWVRKTDIAVIEEMSADSMR